MSKKGKQNSKKEQVFKNIESPPVRATGVAMNYSPQHDVAVFTFTWNPPEDVDSRFITNRVILHWDMVERFNKSLQSFVSDVQRDKNRSRKKAEKAEQNISS